MSWLSSWLHNNKDGLVIAAPYVGAMITATVLSVTFYGTVRMTKGLRKSDMAIQFGKSFDDLMERKHQIQSGQRVAPAGWTSPDATIPNFLEWEVKHYYAQFFALQFIEFYAYRSGYVDPNTYMIWAKSRWRESRSEAIANVTYAAGWQYWLIHRHRSAEDHFTDFTESLHRCHTNDEVEQLVLKSGPLRLKLQPWQS